MKYPTKLEHDNALSDAHDAAGTSVSESASPRNGADTARDRLGPILLVSPLERPVVGRLWALGIAATCGTVLGFAALLQPSPSGLGTHAQLGLGSCGFLLQTGYPCPTCGMTTAFADLMHGHPLRSFLDQPAGFVMALGTAAIGTIALAAVIGGRAVRINWYRVNPVRLAWGFVVFFFASWGFKMVAGLVGGTLPAR